MFIAYLFNYQVKIKKAIYPNSYIKIWWLQDNIGQEDVAWFFDKTTETLFFRHEEDKVKYILKWL